MSLFITPQIDTVRSILWDDLQAPALSIPLDIYQGHLPGSGVQVHSSDRFYRLGFVMIAHSNESGRVLWTAHHFGRPVISGYHHNAVLAAAVGLVIGA